MRWLAIAMLLPILACNQPYNDDHQYTYIADWPTFGSRFPVGHLPLTWRVPGPDLRTLHDPASWREWAIIANADRAEATRIDRAPDRRGLVDLGLPRRLSAPRLAQIREVLAPPRFSFRFSCLPEPGVRIRFFRGDTAADVLICYGCGHIVIARPGELPDVERWIGFGRQRPALIAWARAVFPDEPRFREPLERF